MQLGRPSSILKRFPESSRQAPVISVVFRCDASLLIGSGHVMRCRTLARALRRRGVSVTFVCRSQPGDRIAELVQEFPVLALPPLQTGFVADHAGRTQYASWLGCSQLQDAQDTLVSLHGLGQNVLDWIVVDHYALDSVWHQHVLDGIEQLRRPKLLVIDDLADRFHQADLFLNPTLSDASADDLFQPLLPPNATTLLGPHYALLGPEYALMQPLAFPRTSMQRVLVFFGGVDAANLTARALDALMHPDLSHVEVDVVLGPDAPHYASVLNRVRQRPLTKLHAPLPSLAGLMLRADLAIGAGGGTAFECVCLRLPTLVVVTADNQKHAAAGLARQGNVVLLGSAEDITTQHIQNALIQHRAGADSIDVLHQLVDGWGSARVAAAMLGAAVPIRLRDATTADEALVLRWANDPQARANSLNPQPISVAAHHRWYHAALSDPERLLFIAIDTSDCPLGQIRFDRSASDSPDRERSQARISFLLDRSVRGQGLALHLLHQGLQSMLERWGMTTEAVAEVLSTNTSSMATFAKAGFQCVSQNQSQAAPTSAQLKPSPTWTLWRWQHPGLQP